MKFVDEPVDTTKIISHCRVKVTSKDDEVTLSSKLRQKPIKIGDELLAQIGAKKPLLSKKRPLLSISSFGAGRLNVLITHTVAVYDGEKAVILEREVDNRPSAKNIVSKRRMMSTDKTINKDRGGTPWLIRRLIDVVAIGCHLFRKPKGVFPMVGRLL